MSAAENDRELLRVEDLTVSYKTEKSAVTIIEDINFSVKENEIFGIVGESGSGKTVTNLSIINLLPEKIARIKTGHIIYRGRDLVGLSGNEIQKIRGREISMIFQDPLTSLNPFLKIKTQMSEVLMTNEKISRKDCIERCIEILKRVGIPDPEARLYEHPFQLSGGMQQRIMIAIALLRNPSLLLADEPTTALDVSIQMQILNLILSLKKSFRMSVVIVTHNMGVIAKMCDRVMVLYSGKIMEIGTVQELFSKPKHHYTNALLCSVPKIDQKKREVLTTIPGTPPTTGSIKKGCRFFHRCKFRTDRCQQEDPPSVFISDTHVVHCWNPIAYK